MVECVLNKLEMKRLQIILIALIILSSCKEENRKI